MPRKNSMTTAVGMRTHAMAELRRSERTMPRMIAPTAAIAAACRVATTPSRMKFQTAGSVKMFHRVPSNMPGSVMPPESRGAASVMMTQTAPAMSRTSATIDRMQREAPRPGTRGVEEDARCAHRFTTQRRSSCPARKPSGTVMTRYSTAAVMRIWMTMLPLSFAS